MKRFILGIALVMGLANADGALTKATKIMTAKTTTGAGSTFKPLGPQRSFQGVGRTTASTGASVIAIQVSDDCANFIEAGTITLTLGTTDTSDGFSTDAHWQCVRGYVNSISGTGANVDVWIGN